LEVCVSAAALEIFFHFGFNRLPLNGAAGFYSLSEKGGEKKMTSVVLRPNESQDLLLKRFRKKVVKSGVLSTVRRKRWFVSKSEQRRVERKKSARRIKRRQWQSNMSE
jgi:small subunit ribosomal protein S21